MTIVENKILNGPLPPDKGAFISLSKYKLDTVGEWLFELMELNEVSETDLVKFR